ncbi:MAG: dihydroorotase [Methanomicrobiaceae archaeon]|nr:dihydroorotase [Methanomicrobiaceae archaeon]
MLPCCDLILKNLLMPDGLISDISINDGYVIHSGLSEKSEKVIDCSDYICLPGAVDMHVHMRGGQKQSHKETWESGSKSAVAGGVTTVVDQPNTIPSITNAETFTDRLNEAKKAAFCNFGINGGVQHDSRIDEMYRAGALAFGETFFAESSYGSAVDAQFLKESFLKISKINALATIHAETVLEGVDDSLFNHDILRSQQGEAEAVDLVLKTAPSDLKLHFCHLSSPLSIERIHKRSNTTFEVMPHHLFLSTEMFGEKDGKAKVNPPLRHERTRQQLWEKWNDIDVIASDHAPHTLSEKTSYEFHSVPSGLPGVETMMPLLMAMVIEKKISLNSLIQKTVYNPSRILGIESSGYIKGCKGDFALYPKKTAKIKADLLHSHAGWTPYEGMQGVFPDIVIIGGDIVYDKGEFYRGSGRWIKGKGYIANKSK